MAFRGSHFRKDVSQSRDRTKQLIIEGRVEGQGWAEKKGFGTWSRNGFSGVARIKRAISRGLGEKTEGGFDSSRTTSANTFFLPLSLPSIFLSLPSLRRVCSPFPAPSSLLSFLSLGCLASFYHSTSEAHRVKTRIHLGTDRETISISPFIGGCRSITYTGCTLNFEASTKGTMELRFDLLGWKDFK